MLLERASTLWRGHKKLTKICLSVLTDLVLYSFGISTPIWLRTMNFVIFLLSNDLIRNRSLTPSQSYHVISSSEVSPSSIFINAFA